MILRRFMRHVREQNWFAVFTDLIVLIVGIFLGLQVNNWNEERINRVEERDYVERLLQDAENSLVENDARIERLDQKKSGRDELFDLLVDKSISEQNIARISELYTNSFRPGTRLIYFEDTMDELTSTGKLSVIRSGDFKNKLARFRSKLKEKERIIDLVSQTVAENVRSLSTLILWDINRELIITSPDTLNNNEQIYSHLVTNGGGLTDIHNIDVLFNEEIKIFRDEIAAELERIK